MSWPSVAWLPGVKRVPMYFGGLGDWDGGKPKLLLHTTEGASVAASESAYRNGGFAPHITIGPDPAGGQKVLIDQHYPLTSRSTTLEDPAGGVRTNRVMVLQIEIVGFCDPKWSSNEWYIGNWPDWYWRAVADLCAQLCKVGGIPVQTSVRWTSAYPSTYGLYAGQRLGSQAFADYTGILGHEHAAENHHGDPGNLDVPGKLIPLINAAGGKPQPAPDPKAPTTKPEEDNMHIWLPQGGAPKLPAQRLPLHKLCQVRLGINKHSKRSILSLLWESENVHLFSADADLVVSGLKAGQKLNVRWFRVRKGKDGKMHRTAADGWQQVNGSRYPYDYGRIVWSSGELKPGERLRLETLCHDRGVVIESVHCTANYSQRKAS